MFMLKFRKYMYSYTALDSIIFKAWYKTPTPPLPFSRNHLKEYKIEAARPTMIMLCRRYFICLRNIQNRFLYIRGNCTSDKYL